MTLPYNRKRALTLPPEVVVLCPFLSVAGPSCPCLPETLARPLLLQLAPLLMPPLALRHHQLVEAGPLCPYLVEGLWLCLCLLQQGQPLPRQHLSPEPLLLAQLLLLGQLRAQAQKTSTI